MLQITVPMRELWDEGLEEFIYIEEQILLLEHSLVSLSKWEQTWRKPFLATEKLSPEESRDYIRCMTLNTNVDPMTYKFLTDEIIDQVGEYIKRPMTATWFSKDENAKPSRDIITAEIIYYWMIQMQIPFECENRNLNWLFTLIQVCSEKNKPPKKMSQKEALSRHAALNAARRQQFNSKG